mgnify:CR=1 FL=1
MRGPRSSSSFRVSISGLIPAGAGTTSCRHCSLVRRWAHPRRCGDHGIPVTDDEAETGSSPQVRGPRLGRKCCPNAPRLIPAGAGTTEDPFAAMQQLAAHPRRCGDHQNRRPAWIAVSGSSPQVRGPLISFARPSSMSRLIPAGAGTTHNAGTLTTEGWAHPRRCGDHQKAYVALAVQLGSSPQVRGPQVYAPGYR